MNSRAFLISLIVIVIVLIVGGLYLIFPRSSAPTPVTSTTNATTTIPTSTQVSSATPPPSDPATVSANIVGNWQSTDDSNYIVQITSNGKWTDTYKGSDSSNASETGAYTLFTSAAPDKDFTGVLVPGVVYVKVVEGSSTLYYSVLGATSNELRISYLDKGNTLTFVKVQ